MWAPTAALGVLFIVAVLADPSVRTWVETLSPAWRTLALPLTVLGNSTYMLVGSALVTAVAGGRLTMEPDPAVRAGLRRAIDRAVLFFVVIATSGLAAQFLKHAIGRARPRVADAVSAFVFHPFSLGSGFASFPSGHTTSAFAAATALGLMLPRSRPALFALAVAIGVSRVLLREHYPSDIVGGATLGVIAALAWARAPAASFVMPIVWGWMTDGARRADADGHGPRLGLARPLAAVGAFCARHAAVPALAAGLFAIAVPPTDLFGSATLENLKDGAALLLALAGLTLRALVVGRGEGPAAGPDQPPILVTRGCHAACRHPLYGGNILILIGILLMHGNRWTVLLGTATCLLLYSLMAQAEEDRLLRTFGAAYASYCQHVNRWLPDLGRLRAAARGRLDIRRTLEAEYPVAGMTIVALAAAEFYGEVQEPWVGGQVVYLQVLATIILGVSLAIGITWLARRRSTFGSP